MDIGSLKANLKTEITNNNTTINKVEPKKEILPDNSTKEYVNRDLNDITNLAVGKKSIIASLDIPQISGKDVNKLADKYMKTIENILGRKDPVLGLKDKEEILNLLQKSKDDCSLQKLVEKLDSKKVLSSLYKDMGTLVNQGSGGSAVSGVLALFTLGGSLVSEAKENRAYEMKKLLKDANIAPEILDKLL